MNTVTVSYVNDPAFLAPETFATITSSSGHLTLNINDLVVY